ncbi:MAG: gliding motility lipoprotein GldH [Bacteroidetes bacterium]|nr:gliding motility lipoprotein GldH [Bacteroidota bacterium]
MRITALFLLSLLFIQCKPINLYEQTIDIPQHKWKSDFIPSCTFQVSDTTAQYETFLILRHTDAYPYNNIWLFVQVETPDKVISFRTEQRLGNNEKGWFGTGLNDVYEHRISLRAELTKAGLNGYSKSGPYTFRLTQIMREDPLPAVLQAGIRVERIH